jgi:hypothetical protein
MAGLFFGSLIKKISEPVNIFSAKAASAGHPNALGWVGYISIL